MLHLENWKSAGMRFRKRLGQGILPLIGVYDVFSARLAARRFDGVFCSGFSFAASSYGLPDVGYVNWRDIVDFASRVRHVLPDTHLLVDVDDGFGDEVIAANTIQHLERIGASAVMLEDQKRPRRCGHVAGKILLPMEEYLVKLEGVLERRRDLFVIARTDATDIEEGIQRAVAYANAGADGIMVEAIRDLDVVREIRKSVRCPLMVNQLHGGKSPAWTLEQLEQAGASIVAYSTPCLFAAQRGIEDYLDEMSRTGKLASTGTVSLSECNALLESEWCQPPDPRSGVRESERGAAASPATESV